MAKQPSSPTTSGQSTRKKRGMVTLVKALAFVSLIVVLEVAAASMFIPSSEETRKLGEQLATTGTDEEGADLISEDADPRMADLDETREVELGNHHVLTYDPDTGSSINVDFELYGIVLADEEGEFYDLFQASEKRISEQVTITMRGMEVSDYSDPGLGLIRRKILEKVNRALGRPLLREVVFPKFSYVER